MTALKPYQIGMSEYDIWIDDITYIIVETLDIDHSDAEGIMMANEFLLTQCWGKGLDINDTALQIINKSIQ